MSDRQAAEDALKEHQFRLFDGKWKTTGGVEVEFLHDLWLNVRISTQQFLALLRADAAANEDADKVIDACLQAVYDRQSGWSKAGREAAEQFADMLRRRLRQNKEVSQ